MLNYRGESKFCAKKIIFPDAAGLTTGAAHISSRLNFLAVSLKTWRHYNRRCFALC